jgi:CBS domain-containing protein
MKARDVMTWGVISVETDTPVERAAWLMLQNKFSGLPVVDQKGSLVGIVTEGDFLRRGEIGTQRRRPRWLEFVIGPGRLATEYVHASGRRVSEIMTPDPCTVTPDTPLEEIVNAMERRRIKRLPVVEDGKLVGIVSRSNLMHALARLSTEAKMPVESDALIRDRILTELSKQPWAPHINVVVRDGVVDLSGVLTDERERQAFVVAAENVPGVKAVHDHMAWIEPFSGMILESEEASHDRIAPRDQDAVHGRPGSDHGARRRDLGSHGAPDAGELVGHAFLFAFSDPLSGLR